MYQVQPGDSLWRIAEHFGTSAQAIQDANNLVNANRIYAGQQLLIPGAGAAQAQSPAAPAVPASDQPEAVAAADPPSLTYTVRHGDTLVGIAVRFGLEAGDLQTLNDLDNPNRIYAGQVLVLWTGSAD
jgi:lysozyme